LSRLRRVIGPVFNRGMKSRVSRRLVRTVLGIMSFARERRPEPKPGAAE
jgi:hypothetical protein